MVDHPAVDLPGVDRFHHRAIAFVSDKVGFHRLQPVESRLLTLQRQHRADDSLEISPRWRSRPAPFPLRFCQIHQGMRQLRLADFRRVVDKNGAARGNADPAPMLRTVLRQTLLLGAGGALLTTVCAIPIAWLGVRYPRPLFRLLEGCNYITSSLPGIVTALALVTVTIHYARPVYQTEVTLFLAYLLMFMPRALINLRAGIAQAPVELENVARSLGRSPARALWSITMRLAAPGAAAGAALVFLGVSNELTATLLLSPLGTRTLSTGFWALTSEIDYVAAAPYALLMIVISLPLTAVLYMQSKKMAGL